MISSRMDRKILVVDDEPLIRQTLRFCLEDEYEVRTVSSGEEAIKASLKENFPVVILDLRMDGMSGLQTLKELRKINEDQKVIILTAYKSMESAISALNSGAFNYITKPFNGAHLKEVISRGFADYDQQTFREKEMRQRLMGVHDEFFSLLCHEFNTPLNIILGFSDLLSQEIKNPQHSEWIRDVQQHGQYLHRILMEIVDYTAASHLAAAGVRNEFTLEALLKSAWDNQLGKEAHISCDLQSSWQRKLKGHSDSLRMIARKMLSMAMHYSKSISVAASLDTESGEESTRLHLVVRAVGSHLGSQQKAELEKLFEPYEATSPQEGLRYHLGLELATCRKIAEYAHGSVDCSVSASGELILMVDFPVTLLA